MLRQPIFIANALRAPLLLSIDSRPTFLAPSASKADGHRLADALAANR